MKLLVTGGAGFIGSNFIKMMMFAQYPEIEITNLDKLTYAGNPEKLKEISDPGSNFVTGDICDPEIVMQAIQGADVVVHFAAENHVDRSIADSSVFVITNVVGTNKLLKCAMDSDIKQFIHVSTDEVYGSIQEGSFTETDNLNPSSPYSSSKAGSDLLAMSYYNTYGLPVTITRCTNNFSPYQYPEKLIPLFITNLMDGKQVPVYGTGLNIRDWIYVEDHCSGIDFFMQHGKAGGIAEALGLVKDFADNDNVTVILGDNIFQDNIKEAVENFKNGARIFLKSIPDSHRFGVAEVDKNSGHVLGIEEKPAQPKSDLAMTGLYIYSNDVFDVIKTLKPSSRGDFEITDVNNYYIKIDQVKFSILDGYWSDARTFESLLRASMMVQFSSYRNY